MQDPRPSLSRTPRHDRGFTALELMVVVSIVAVLAALALPSFSGIIERYRVRTAIEDLTSSIYLGRSEAIRRGGNVILAKTSAPGCTSTGNSDWSCGWVLFVDTNENGVLDAGEQQLQAPKVPKGVKVSRISGTPSANMQFSRWGNVGSLMNSYGLYPDGAGSASTASPERTSFLCISSGGRARRVDGANTC